MRQALGKATAVVAASWWLGLYVWGIATARIDPFTFETSWTLGSFALIGVAVGLGATLWWVAADKEISRKDLVESNVRGLVSTVGAVPFVIEPPTQLLTMPPLVAPDVPADFFPRWFNHYGKTHPRHVALAKRLFRILGAHHEWPAGYAGSAARGGVQPHGGRTLKEHSMHVAYLAHRDAPTFRYTGSASKVGTRPGIALRDPRCTFNALDPLVMIVGLAHDIGKLEAFIMDDSGKVVGSRREHDRTGARILARLEETWSLAEEDRRALSLAVGHYHAPTLTPMAPDGLPLDDRAMCLLELLVQADKQASAKEHLGAYMPPAQLEEAMKAPLLAEPPDPDRLFQIFVAEINNVAAINSASVSGNLAWYANVKGENRPRLAVNEGNFAALVGQITGVDHDVKNGAGVRMITIEMMEELARRGILLTSMKTTQSIDRIEYAAGSAVWDVSFVESKAGKLHTKIAGVKVFFVDPEKFDFVADAVSIYKWQCVVERGVTGAGGRKAARRKGEYDAERSAAVPQQGSLPIETEQPSVDASMRDVELPGSRVEADAHDLGAIEGETVGQDPLKTSKPPASNPVDARGRAEPKRKSPRPATARSGASSPPPSRPPAAMEAKPVGEEAALPVFEARAPLPRETTGTQAEETSGIETARDLMVQVVAAFSSLREQGTAGALRTESWGGRSYIVLSLDDLERGLPTLPWRKIRAKVLVLAKDPAMKLEIRADALGYAIGIPVSAPAPVEHEQRVDHDEESAI